MPEEMRMEFLSAVRSDEGLGIVQGYYTSISGQNPDTIAAVMADAAKVSKPARVGVTEALLGWDPQTAITAWNGRLKIVITPPNNTPASLRFLIEQADVELLSTNGHWPHLDDPDLISRLINLFVSKLN